MSNGLRVVGCVQCGRAMTPYKSDAYFLIVPSRWMLTFATFTSQLLGLVTFLLAAAWMLRLGHHNVPVIAVALFGALSVFAGGHAHRGSVGALGMCAAVDLAIGVASLLKWPIVMRFVYYPTAWAAPKIANDLVFALSIASFVALIAAAACVFAVPQTRRYLAWHRTQMTLAPPIF